MPSYKVEYEIRSLTTSERERERAAYASPLAAKLKKKTHFEKKKTAKLPFIVGTGPNLSANCGQLVTTTLSWGTLTQLSQNQSTNTHTHNVKLNTQKDGRRIERNSAIANRKKLSFP